MRNLSIPAAVFLVAALASSAPAAEKTFTATVVLQKGLNGYEDASDSSLRAGKLKLDLDKKREIDGWQEGQIKQGKAKREDVVEALGNYRHLFRFPGLDRFTLGKNAKVVSAKFEVYYVDEFWSFADYKLKLYRSLDGSKDNVEKEPAAESHVLGSRNGKDSTPFLSWIAFDIRPEVVQAWIDDPKQNQGLVLANPSRDDPPGKRSEGFFLIFTSNTSGMPNLRPRLTITYKAEGNVPPFAPTILNRFAGVTAGATQPVRWSMPEKPDLNGDAIHFELETSPADAEAWTPVAKDIAGDAREYAWNTAAAPEGKPLRLRLRAVDAEGAASAWTEGDGAFTVVRRDVPFQIGAETSFAKLRREEPYRGPIGNGLSIELAGNEYEGAQLVISGVTREVRNLRVTASPLAFMGQQLRSVAEIPASNVSVSFIGYVHTAVPDKYTAEWTGLWPDPLLNVESVTLAPGKVQPVMVSVYVPAGTTWGPYGGTLTISGDGIDPVKVPFNARVFAFDLPVRGTFRTFATAGEPSAKFYGVADGSPEHDKLKEMWYDFLCKHRLAPGGWVLKAWGWMHPGYPAKAKPDGTWDFSEAERWGKYCYDRGMNTFIAAHFIKLGKYGFPKEYSPEYRAEFKKFMTAYAEFLRKKGWLKDAVVYNIDEAPESMWEACKENYRRTKEVSPDLKVFQCLNEVKGVEALGGFFDILDAYYGQYNGSATPQVIAKGTETWLSVCCWPASHPNLFTDYPGIDARIFPWLSWKVGAVGFEYWSVASWGNCMKPMGDKKFVDEVESAWVANAAGNYNGEGYLVYPGPNNTLLSCIRFEALRDGFEDYEYLAILRKRLEGKSGPAADEARKLLDLPDALCKKDLSYASDPKLLFETRRKIAEAIEKLGR